MLKELVDLDSTGFRKILKKVEPWLLCFRKGNRGSAEDMMEQTTRLARGRANARLPAAAVDSFV